MDVEQDNFTRAFAAADPDFGTAYHHISWMRTYRTVGSSGH